MPIAPGTGSLEVTIEPPEAIATGAKWQVDNGPYQDSGTTLSGLSPGDHTVTFAPVIGYILPPDQSVTITANQTITITGTYVLIPTGSVQVTIEPPGAIAAGAQWQIEGYPLQDSGAILSGLNPGTYPIIFTGVLGYAPPPNRSLTVVAGETATTTGTYVLIPTGSLKVTIKPAGAIAAGARWQVDGGPYQSSGTKLSGLAPGTHTVTFAPVPGYIVPANQDLMIFAGQTTTSTGTYTFQ